MILSGSLTIFGVVALNAGWLNTDSGLNSSAAITLQSQQKDKSILETSTSAKNSANVDVFSGREPSLVKPDSQSQPVDATVKTDLKENYPAADINSRTKSMALLQP